jgi:glucokinase
MILAGDIGGTNTRLALFQVIEGRASPVVEQKYPSRDYKSLNEIVRQFISSNNQPIERACFGIAGPVKSGRSEVPNLAWVVEADKLANELGLGHVGLINDLEANGYGVAVLGADDFQVLNEGEPDSAGNAAIISAGTGLGEAGFYWDGLDHRPFATEGGHTDFSPRNDLEMELLKYLLTQFNRVSYERALSGPGLLNIYKFLRDTGRGEEPDWLAAEMREHDASATISKAALEGRSALCEQALEMFVSFYGAEAGNLALKVMATAGVFVGGGIAPKIIKKLKDTTFMDAFTAKGRLTRMMKAIPVKVILNDKTALLGAARCAMLSEAKGGARS